jgi:hypothetical protein
MGGVGEVIVADADRGSGGDGLLEFAIFPGGGAVGEA